MREYLEREDKYEVGDEFVVPDLVGVAGGVGAEPLDEMLLVNTYFDTPDGDLRRRRVTLRRRVGGTDEGWQLKIPREDARAEIRMPLGDGRTPPPQLVEIVTGVALGKPLGPAVAMMTARTITRVLDPAGSVLLEVDDDRVEADVVDDTGRPVHWREVEVELGSAPPQALVAVRERMLEAGASIAAAASKPDRALGTPEPPPRSAAQAAVADYLATQVDAIVLGDVALRRGLDPIHDVRVAIRRLRSTLRVFGAQVEAPPELDGELKWFAGLLGEVRDRHVQRRHFAAAIAATDPKYVLGPAAADLDATLNSEQITARTEVAHAMDGERYRHLLATVTELARDERTVANAKGKRLRKAARRSARKVDKRLAAALDAEDDELLHRARKAAKRARYAAELTAPVRGTKAKRARKHYKRIQRVLGDHQDAVVAADTLWHAATRAGAAGRNGFTYGLLLAREQARADRAVARLSSA